MTCKHCGSHKHDEEIDELGFSGCPDWMKNMDRAIRAAREEKQWHDSHYSREADRIAAREEHEEDL